MKKLSIYTYGMLTLVMGIFGCAIEDSDRLDQEEVFIKYFGSRDEEELIDMIQLEDEGLLLLSSTKNTEFDNRDFYLLRTDRGGNRLWDIQYQEVPELLNGDDVPSSIKLSEDGSHGILVGTVDYASENEAAMIIEFSLDDGSVLEYYRYQYFEKRGDPEFEGFKRTRGVDVIENGDDYIVLGGTMTYLEPASPQLVTTYNLLLSKIPNDLGSIPADNPEGSQVYYRVYGDDRVNNEGVKLIKTLDDDYFFLGVYDDINTLRKGIVVASFNEESGIIDDGGSELYGTDAKNEIPTNIIVDGSYLVITGRSVISDENDQSPEPFMLRVNKDNLGLNSPIVTWTEFTEQFIEGGAGYDIATVSSNGIYPGSYYLSGRVKSFSSDKQDEVFIVNVATDGSLLSDFEVFGSDGNDAGNCIEINEDGSILIGATVDFGFDEQVLSVIKTNKFGKIE
ncbi:hypothetical protein [Reichenbachiella versicolor]|uniref:hypothetical protein n=1 Tax=Reichenbachiella versicolor TaxID=1821036 RepID=UPI0013A5321C|nr:hypothetical protein [Reichenbachiella versicolor]